MSSLLISNISRIDSITLFTCACWNTLMSDVQSQQKAFTQSPSLLSHNPMMVTNYLSWTLLYSAEQGIGKSRRKESAHRQKRADDRGLWANRWQQWEVSGLRGRLRVADTKTAWEVRRGWVEKSGCETRQIHLPKKAKKWWSWLSWLSFHSLGWPGSTLNIRGYFFCRK